MCKYCKTDSEPLAKLKLGDRIFAAPAKYTFWGDGQEYNVPMRFCPACGKKLIQKCY